MYIACFKSLRRHVNIMQPLTFLVYFLIFYPVSYGINSSGEYFVTIGMIYQITVKGVPAHTFFTYAFCSIPCFMYVYESVLELIGKKRMDNILSFLWQDCRPEKCLYEIEHILQYLSQKFYRFQKDVNKTRKQIAVTPEYAYSLMATGETLKGISVLENFGETHLTYGKTTATIADVELVLLTHYMLVSRQEDAALMKEKLKNTLVHPKKYPPIPKAELSAYYTAIEAVDYIVTGDIQKVTKILTDLVPLCRSPWQKLTLEHYIAILS